MEEGPQKDAALLFIDKELRNMKIGKQLSVEMLFSRNSQKYTNKKIKKRISLDKPINDLSVLSQHFSNFFGKSLKRETISTTTYCLNYRNT